MKKAALPLQSAASTSKKERDGGPQEKEEQVLQVLKRHFGHTSFRGRQQEAIETVLSGRDCFCLMPTGGGKSLCYQIPALLKPGIVLVVSPLIALMENQVASLKSHSIAAEFLSSTLNLSTRSKIYEDLDSSKPLLKLLYVTPELIATKGFMANLKKLHSRSLLSLIAIDEAHCISSWGHDFRPSYRRLSVLKNDLPGIPVLALTATAAKRVQEDIIKSLCLYQPKILVASFNRANIFYEVRYKNLMKNAYENLLELLKSSKNDCAIIYCHARNTCDDLGSRLQADGISCRVYHAGLGDKVRTQALQEWASGQIPVVIGTVAFGMGIDRKDVRLVCHFNIPKSIESFYQESGRAGRDQQPARSVLYYGLEDRKSIEFILHNNPKVKGEKKNAHDPSLKKGIEDFQQIIAYCEGTGCRRLNILSHFGEQVSSTLCARTCDACKYPDQVKDAVKQLSEVSSMQGPNKLPHVFISRPANRADDWSEFWNETDEDAEDSGEEISDSDDEGADLAAAAAAAKSYSHSKNQLEKKLNSLLQAEQAYIAKQRPQQEKPKLNERKLVNQSSRDIAKIRLTSAASQALQRLQDTSSNAAVSGTILENDCYQKYGKSGRSFYNSQVASTVRWLASCSLVDLQTRICHEGHVTPGKLEVATKPEQSRHDSIRNVKDLPVEEAHNQTVSIEVISRVEESSNIHVDSGKVESKDTLPPILSFHDFVSQKRQPAAQQAERQKKKAFHQRAPS